MKIADLKKGDKLFCIKTYIDSKIDQEKTNDKRRNFLNGRTSSDLTPEERKIYYHIGIEFKNCERLIENKTYIVTSKLGEELTISSEYSDDITIYKNIDIINSNTKHEDFLDEYFITDVQARKIKLEKLSDNNFNSFLQKLKK
jgi:Fe-S cluster assembly scaffold protein SufB